MLNNCDFNFDQINHDPAVCACTCPALKCMGIMSRYVHVSTVCPHVCVSACNHISVSLCVDVSDVCERADMLPHQQQMCLSRCPVLILHHLTGVCASVWALTCSFNYTTSPREGSTVFMRVGGGL